MQTNISPRIRGETTTPRYTADLVIRDGVTKAAKALGVSTTTLHKARATNEVSKVVEVAAAGILKWAKPPAAEERSFSPAARVQEVPNLNPSLETDLYLIEVPREQAPLVERFAQAIHAHVLRA
jgi:hypothetical protein